VLTNGDISPVRLMWGTAARMDAISNGEADLVFAGPPYFSEETESHLLKPLKQQTDFNLVKDLLKRDTEELVECYTDITRILKPGRALVIQIKDLCSHIWLAPRISHSQWPPTNHSNFMVTLSREGPNRSQVL
jgi:DNA modification methylase